MDSETGSSPKQCADHPHDEPNHQRMCQDPPSVSSVMHIARRTFRHAIQHGWERIGTLTTLAEDHGIASERIDERGAKWRRGFIHDGAVIADAAEEPTCGVAAQAQTPR
jgi:hypothetical protein